MRRVYAVLAAALLFSLGFSRPALAASFTTITGSRGDGHLSPTGAYTWSLSNSKLVAGDTNSSPDAHLRNNATGAVTLLSATASGSAVGMALGATVAVSCGTSNVSSDGRYAVFAASGTVIPTVSDGLLHMYRKDLSTGAVLLIDQTSASVPGSTDADKIGGISSDGLSIAFTTASALVSSDTDTYVDAYVWRATSGLTLVSPSVRGGDNGVRLATGGAYVVFNGFSPIVVSGCYDDYCVRLSDLSVVNVTQNPAGKCAHTTEFSVSPDGSRVAFVTNNNYDAADVAADDAYLWTAATGQIKWLSVPYAGATSQPSGSQRLFALGPLTSDGLLALGTTVRLNATASQSSATAATAYLMDTGSGATTTVAPGTAPSYLIGNRPSVNDSASVLSRADSRPTW